MWRISLKYSKLTLQQVLLMAAMNVEEQNRRQRQDELEMELFQRRMDDEIKQITQQVDDIFSFWEEDKGFDEWLDSLSASQQDHYLLGFLESQMGDMNAGPF